MYIHILNIYVYTTGAADKGPIGLRNAIYLYKYMYIHIFFYFFLYVSTTGAADKGPIGLRNSARTLGPPGAFRGRVYAPSQAGDTDIVYGKRDLVI
jgi:hypothetical protein